MKTYDPDSSIILGDTIFKIVIKIFFVFVCLSVLLLKIVLFIVI